MPQTTIGFRQGQAISEGQYATTAQRRIDGAIENFKNGLAGILPFGRVVVRDPADTTRQKVILPTAAAATQPPIGICVLDEEWGISLADLQSAVAPTLGYPQGDNVIVGVTRMCDIWMYTEEAVVAGDAVQYRYASGAAGTQLGRVRKTAVASETSTLPNAQFLTPASANSLVIVRLFGG